MIIATARTILAASVDWIVLLEATFREESSSAQ